MIFRINYPSEITAPKGLHLPSLEIIIQAVNLAETVANYIDAGYEDGDEFITMVTGEVSVSDGKLVDFCNTGEGLTIYPSANHWSIESVFESILFCLFRVNAGQKPAVAISIENLTEIAEEMETMINFIWGLQDKLPLVKDFCDEHEHILDTSISLSEKTSMRDRD